MIRMRRLVADRIWPGCLERSEVIVRWSGEASRDQWGRRLIFVFGGPKTLVSPIGALKRRWPHGQPSIQPLIRMEGRHKISKVQIEWLAWMAGIGVR